MRDLALVLAAAGSGSRFVGDRSSSTASEPKQCKDLMGMPLYMWSLLAFGLNKHIGRIVFVTREDLIESSDATIQNFLFQNNLNEIYARVEIIKGGDSRQESVYFGLKHLENQPPTHVLVHDAARPYVTQDLINEVVKEAIEHGAAIPALAVTDTIKRGIDGFIIETLDRSSLYQAQTPQAAEFQKLLSAHQKARDEEIDVTDDAAILERVGGIVKLVPGTAVNIKITVEDDLTKSRQIAENILGQINEALSSKK